MLNFPSPRARLDLCIQPLRRLPDYDDPLKEGFCIGRGSANEEALLIIIVYGMAGETSEHRERVWEKLWIYVERIDK